MTVKINYYLADGSEDYVLIDGETEEEIKERAEAEVKKRGGTNPWSEPL